MVLKSILMAMQLSSAVLGAQPEYPEPHGFYVWQNKYGLDDKAIVGDAKKDESYYTELTVIIEKGHLKKEEGLKEDDGLLIVATAYLTQGEDRTSFTYTYKRSIDGEEHAGCPEPLKKDVCLPGVEVKATIDELSRCRDKHCSSTMFHKVYHRLTEGLVKLIQEYEQKD